MKKTLKQNGAISLRLIAIIALVAIAAFSFAVCDDGGGGPGGSGGGGGGSTGSLSGTRWESVGGGGELSFSGSNYSIMAIIFGEVERGRYEVRGDKLTLSPTWSIYGDLNPYTFNIVNSTTLYYPGDGSTYHKK
jgi:hypothetical protein